MATSRDTGERDTRPNDQHDAGSGGDAEDTRQSEGAGERSQDLRGSPMMAHLLEALQAGTDIGHYGRLTFVMVARFFLDDEEMTRLLTRQPDVSEEDARGLIAQVRGHGYNPSKRDRILEWQSRQEFPICPNSDEPQACNVYSELEFPDDDYENISEYWEDRAETQTEARQHPE